MERFHRIIAAVDLGRDSQGENALDDHAELALARAAWLAGKVGAELRILSVEWLSVAIEPPWRNAARPDDRPVVKRLVERLDALAEAPRQAGVRTTVEARFGHATEQIIEAASAWEADLVVVGGAHRAGVLGLLGSTSSDVFRQAPCSVWIARGSSGPSRGHPLHEALVVLSPDDRARGVLKVAARFAHENDSELHVLGITEEDGAMAAAQVQQSLREWTGPYASQVRFGSVEAVAGDSAQVILDGAARIGSEVVFMGPSRRSALAAFLGTDPTGSALRGLSCSLICARSR